MCSLKTWYSKKGGFRNGDVIVTLGHPQILKGTNGRPLSAIDCRIPLTPQSAIQSDISPFHSQSSHPRHRTAVLRRECHQPRCHIRRCSCISPGSNWRSMQRMLLLRPRLPRLSPHRPIRAGGHEHPPQVPPSEPRSPDVHSTGSASAIYGVSLCRIGRMPGVVRAPYSGRC